MKGIKQLSIFLIFLIIGCAKAPEKSQLKISLSNIISDTNPFPGGAFLEARIPNTEKFVRFDLDDSYSFELPYGTWTLRLVGWSGNQSYAGDIYCGMVIALEIQDIEEIDVRIDTQKTNCNMAKYQSMIHEKIQRLSYFFTGNTADGFGSYITELGDVDGDGFTDLGIGLPFNDDAGLDAGKVRIVSGRNSNLIYEIKGANTGDNFGYALVSLGDINGDELNDFAIGAPLNDDGSLDAGKVYIIDGASGSILDSQEGLNSGDKFGYTLGKTNHDYNGDNIHEILIAAPFNDYAAVNAGKVYLTSIDRNGALTPIYQIDGTQASERMGSSKIIGGFDIDSDGIMDIATSSSTYSNGASNEGVIKIFSGTDASTLHIIEGTVTNAYLGSDFLFHDFNQDGVVDLVAGAPGISGGTGQVKILDGKNLTTLLHGINGENSNDYFGKRLAIVDRNLDGVKDLVVSAPEHDGNGVIDSGKVYFYNGEDKSKFHEQIGKIASGKFGYKLLTLKDINNDRFEDLLITEEGPGNVYIY